MAALAAGPDAADFFHWHLEILPLAVRPGAFDLGTGSSVNPTPPEEAAAFLRAAGEPERR